VRSTEPTGELTVRSRPRDLAAIRRWLERVGKAHGLSSGDIADLKVAASEACTNIIRHAYRGDPSQRIVLRATPSRDGMEITIRDFAPPFDPIALRPPDPGEPREGGYGIFLIRQLTDTVEFSRPEGGGNQLRMVKRRHSSRKRDRGGTTSHGA